MLKKKKTRPKTTSAVSQRGLYSERPLLLWGRTWRGGVGRGGEEATNLLGNRAWAWDVRTSLWGSRLGWRAGLGARVGLGTCVVPGRGSWATEPTTAPARAWPRAPGAAPTTYCPAAVLPEGARAEGVEVLLAGVLLWAFRTAPPDTVRYKGVWDGGLLLDKTYTALLQWGCPSA